MSLSHLLKNASKKFAVGLLSFGTPLSSLQKEEAKQHFSKDKFSEYLDFITLYNGASFFHEEYIIYSLDKISLFSEGLQGKSEPLLLFGNAPMGELFLCENNQVWCTLHENKDWLFLSSSLEKFLDIMLARLSLLYDIDGEFLDVFGPDGEIKQNTQLKMARITQQKDPASTWGFWEEGILYILRKKETLAIDFLNKALSLEPKAGACWFSLSLIYKEQKNKTLEKTCLLKAANFCAERWLYLDRIIDANLLTFSPKEMQELEQIIRQNSDLFFQNFDSILQKLNPNEEDNYKQELEKRLSQFNLIKNFLPNVSEKITIEKKLDFFQRRTKLANTLRVL